MSGISKRNWIVFGACLSLAANFASAQEHRSCKVDHTPPSEADQAYARREFPRAEEMYTAMLSADPASSVAKVGIVRSELAQDKLQDALNLARKNSADHPKDPLLLVVLGEAELRDGEPLEAGRAFNAAGVIDPCIARLHYDLGRSLSFSAMGASARRELETAHKLAPEDPVIEQTWKRITAPPVPIEDRIARLEKDLAEPGVTPDRKQALQNSVNWARAQQGGNCQIVGAEVPSVTLPAEVPSVTLPMVVVSDGPSRPVTGMGLEIGINGKRKRLTIDTGVSGLVLNRSAALSAGLVPESEVRRAGLGDQGPTTDFLAHVDSLRIGPMEFRNCIVRVLGNRNVLTEDGALGTDVFASYIVTLDTPGRQFRLTPLPKRLSDHEETASLSTEGQTAGASQKPAEDAYIAPEMRSWSPIYRAGPRLIVPTRIGNAPSKLFLIETGSPFGLISPEAAKEVTRVSKNGQFSISSLGGKSTRVAETEAITIGFAGIQQKLPSMGAFDTSSLSDGLGMRISGTIGLITLQQIVLSIDYRDNLLHAVYDPKHGFH